QGGEDAVKEWFWSGAGQSTRAELADAHLWGGTSGELAHSRAASDGFIDSVVDRVKLATGEHPELMDAVAHGEGFGLHGTSRDLLYYPGERVSATDKLRNVMPFGEAWRNVLKTWTKLGAENPRVFRRVEQGLTSLRDGGFVYQDPQSGKEVFKMVPGGLMKHL